MCSADKVACIFEVLWLQDLRFYRDFQDWELAASYSLLEFIQSHIPRDTGSDTLCWCLKGNGRFDTQSFYHEIQDA